MVGATADAFARVKPLLEAMGTTIHHCGGAGTGMRTKLVNNYLAIVSCAFNAEALALSQRFGLSLEKTLDVVHGTTATNGQLKIAWAAKVLKGDTEPGFTIDLAHKDLTLIVAPPAPSRSRCRSGPPPWSRSPRRGRKARVRRIFPRWSTSCATPRTSIDHGFHEDEMATTFPNLIDGRKLDSTDRMTDVTVEPVRARAWDFRGACEPKLTGRSQAGSERSRCSWENVVIAGRTSAGRKTDRSSQVAAIDRGTAHVAARITESGGTIRVGAHVDLLEGVDRQPARLAEGGARLKRATEGY